MTPLWQVPESILAAVLAPELVLARTDEVCVAIPTLGVYESGFELELLVRLRSDAGEPLSWAMHVMGPRPPWVGVEYIFRFAVRYADGRIATNLQEHPGMHAAGSGITMICVEGGSSGRAAAQRWYVQPLPSPGPVTFICEWPAFGVPETYIDIDASTILDARHRAVRLWPEPAARGAIASSLAMHFDGEQSDA